VIAKVGGRARKWLGAQVRKPRLDLEIREAALISLLSLLTMSTGVLLGAPMPNHTLASKPGKNSLTVGMSGSTSERFAVVTASARSLPVRTCSIKIAVVAK
jgi:hypothetical protein